MWAENEDMVFKIFFFFYIKKINEEISNIQILAANINMIGKIDMPKHKGWHSSGMFPQATRYNLIEVMPTCFLFQSTADWVGI